MLPCESLTNGDPSHGGRKSLWKTHHKEQGRRERLYIANEAGGMGFAELLLARLKTSGFSTGF